MTILSVWTVLLPAGLVRADTNPPPSAATNATTFVFSANWKMEHLSVPKVNFRDADPRDVVKYLQEQSGTLSPDQQPINVVWLVPREDKLPRVSLNLANIPLAEALKYTVRAAQLGYRVETHAVVIYRPERPAPAGDHAPAR